MKIISTILYALLIVLLVSVAGVFLASLVPIPGHLEIKIVRSGSMEPKIMTGSIVVIRPADSYAVGDVITFGADTRTQIPTTHRIVEIAESNGYTVFTTKGDANEDADPEKTRLQDVQGKVFISVPYAGYVLDFAKKPLGFTLMIAVPAGIIIVDEVLRIVGEIAELRRKKQIV